MSVSDTTWYRVAHPRDVLVVRIDGDGARLWRKGAWQDAPSLLRLRYGGDTSGTLITGAEARRLTDAAIAGEAATAGA